MHTCTTPCTNPCTAQIAGQPQPQSHSWQPNGNGYTLCCCCLPMYKEVTGLVFRSSLYDPTCFVRAPPYSDLIAFTDEGGDDEVQLQKTVIALAQDKKCKINIIWTESLWVTYDASILKEALKHKLCWTLWIILTILFTTSILAF